MQPAPAKRGTEARHDLSCAALAHTEEPLDRRAVEVSGCHGTQGAEDFIKSMKPGWLGENGQATALLHIMGRSRKEPFGHTSYLSRSGGALSPAGP